MNLSDEQINSALRELAGWKFHASIDVTIHGVPTTVNQTWVLDNDDGFELYQPEAPDFLNSIESLGHLHELTLRLPEEKRCAFNTALMDQFKNARFGLHLALNATPHQRALALLRVLKPEMFL